MLWYKKEVSTLLLTKRNISSSSTKTTLSCPPSPSCMYLFQPKRTSKTNFLETSCQPKLEIWVTPLAKQWKLQASWKAYSGLSSFSSLSIAHSKASKTTSLERSLLAWARRPSTSWNSLRSQSVHISSGPTGICCTWQGKGLSRAWGIPASHWRKSWNWPIRCVQEEDISPSPRAEHGAVTQRKALDTTRKGIKAVINEWRRKRVGKQP